MTLEVEVDTSVFERQIKQIEDPTEYRKVLLKAGLLIETRIKANASGRPGPRVVTGNYRRSWNTRAEGEGRNTTVIVGSNTVYGPRLEYGFVGTDSLGRTYNQPPFPHVAPAVAQSRQQVLDMIERSVNESARRAFQ